MAQYNGYDFSAGNLIGVSAGFANPAALPTVAPDCTGHTNVTECMNAVYGVYAKITPFTGLTSKGYQPPAPCTPDTNWPSWLKGVVYLQWTGTGLVQKSGRPCGNSS
ncbi:MAG TPA: hypothetical protein VFE60_23985 [Roseiarcus sp.]|jgi:hypothetical protein|nr:hypothetical protein [Roseiarcus sp.]